MNFRELLQVDPNMSLGSSYDLVTEAAFSEAKLGKVVRLYSKVLGRAMGGEFKPMGLESYNRKWGPGRGYRVINNKGIMIRFNWDSKMAKVAKYDLTSMDFWASSNTNLQRPTRTVKFAPDLNVVQILSVVSSALMTGHLKEANKELREINDLLEARTKAERADFADAHGLPKSSSTSPYHLRKASEKKGLSDLVEIFLGTTETNSLEGDIKAAEKKFSTEVYADPDTVFEDIEDLLGVVISGDWRTLIVCGQGGIGKTYHITEGPKSLEAIFGPEGERWTYHAGTKASPLSFYKTLFQERDKIIVFDEADAVLKHQEIIMMLKPILDTSGKNLAEYITGTTNMVGKSPDELEAYAKYVDAEIAGGKIIGKRDTEESVALPSKFKFTGGMIFISNMRASEIEQAIMSRSIFIDVYLAQSDMLKRIKSVGYAQADNKRTYGRGDVDEVLVALGDSPDNPEPEEKITYMTPEYARKSKQVTVRALQLGLILKASGLTRWKELTALYA